MVLAIYLMVCDKCCISALSLAGKIEVSYKTAGHLLRRIRATMEIRDEHYVLQGIVEFDDSYFGAGKKEIFPARVVVPEEIRLSSWRFLRTRKATLLI